MKLIRLLVVLAALCGGEAAWGQVSPLVVTTTADSGPGSLRNAIIYANSFGQGCPVSIGVGPSITFNIPTGPFTIQPLSPLPQIACTTATTTIDGFTQSGSSPNTLTTNGNNAVLVITIDGSACGTGCPGLDVAAGATIRGLVITKFAGGGIVAHASNQVALNGNNISSNSGHGIDAQSGFVRVGDGSPGGRNIIASNSGAGVHAGGAIEVDVNANHINNNGQPGVLVGGGTANIIGNLSVSGNGTAGIDYLGTPPWSPPQITSFTYDSVANQTTIGFQVTNNGGPSFSDRVDFYSNGSLPATAEGQAFFGTMSIALDTSGNFSGTATFPGSGTYLTATFTKCNDGCISGTSEFSNPVQPAVVTAAFNPASIPASGGATELLFVVHNANGSAMTGAQYSFALPSPLKMSTAPTWDTDCGTAFTHNADTTAGTVDVSGLNLSGGQNCTLHVPIQTPPAGSYSISPGAMAVKSSFGIGQPTSPATLTVTQPIITASPSPLAFGNVAVGTSATATVTVNNIGNGDLHVNSVAFAGAGLGYAISSDTCSGNTVPPSASTTPLPCTITITFTPTAAAAFNSQLQITSDSTPLSILVSGQGTAPALSIAPSSVAFGSVFVGNSATTDVTLTNKGNATLNLSSIAISNPPGPVVFTQAASPTPCGATLAAGSSCVVRVKFAPAAPGTAYSGTLDIASNDPSSPTTNISLVGTGTAQSPTLSPASVDFGKVPVGGSASLPVTITNNASVAIGITGTFLTGNGFSQSPACPASLAPGASCNVTLTFKPTSATTFTGTLQVGSPDTTPSTVSVPLTGTGVSSGLPIASLSATSLTFARQVVGTTSAPQTAVLTNTGSKPLNIASIAISGDFGYTGCGFPLTLAPGASCTFSVTFSPLANGTRTGAISITDDASGSPHTVALSGVGANGPQPGITVRPSALDFGDVRVGAQRSDVVTITSNGSAPLAISSISINGPGFTQSNACPASLPVGGTCDITVFFLPTALGPFASTMTVSSNGDPTAFNISLAGNGVPTPPAVLTVDRFLDFGQRVIGSTTRLTLDLRNTGEQALNITSASLAGVAFGLEGSCTSIAPAGVCTLTIVFTPASVDTFTGSLTIASNDARGLARIDLLGQGVALPKPELELSVSGVGFANQLATTTGRQTLTLRSVGTAPLHIRGVSTAAPFAASSGCPATLAVGATCNVDVTFTPPVPGTFVGRLTVDSDDPDGPASVSLTGTGCSFPTVAGRRSLVPVCH